MTIRILVGLILILIILPGCTRSSLQTVSPTVSSPSPSPAQIIKLPEPRLKSTVSLEESIQNRRSIREYSQTPLTLNDVSQLLWSAQGITSDTGGRSAPSAGALYPIEVYLISGNVENLPPGVYKYQAQGHSLIPTINQDIREKLTEAALGQFNIKNAGIDIVISAIYDRMAPRYGDRGIRYALLETGHAAQNILLQAVALDLGAVTVGAFDDNQVKRLIEMSENESPLYIISIGKK